MNVVLASGDAQTVSGSHSDFIQSHFERSHSTLDLNNQKVENLWGNLDVYRSKIYAVKTTNQESFLNLMYGKVCCCT